MPGDGIAVLHGNYFQRGGGEVVADTLAKVFDAPLYYGFGCDDVMPDDGVDRRQIFDPGTIQRWVAHNNSHARDALFMWCGQHLPELHEYDTIIISGNEFGWYVPRDYQTVVKYIHSPPRGAYDMFHRNGESRAHRAYSLAVKTLYRHTITTPARTVANSELVARRCRMYWGIKPDIVYPPIDVSEYGPENATTDHDQPTYLTFSRLYRHKRTREIVQAFADLPDAKLIVGGDGPQRETLEEIAGENVEIRGYLEEAEKRRLLAEVDALIFNARNEDFGIVPIEAFASGTPVLGIRDGYTAHQITDGWNGVLFDDGTPRQIAEAVRVSQQMDFALPEELVAFAEQFGVNEFSRRMHRVVAEARENEAVTGVAELATAERVEADD